MNYKHAITLNFHSLIQSEVSLHPTEHIFFTWAYEAAKAGKAGCLEEDKVRYFEFKSADFRQQLPTVRIGNHHRFNNLLKILMSKGLLMPHPNRACVGAYYAFTPLSKKIFNDTSNI